MTIHRIKFAHAQFDDIITCARTLAHILVIKSTPRFHVGDYVALVAHRGESRDRTGGFISWGPTAVITSAATAPLEVTESDRVLLNAKSVTDYLARWDALHPDHPAVRRPLTWRIEWTFKLPGDPTWCLAG